MFSCRSGSHHARHTNPAPLTPLVAAVDTVSGAPAGPFLEMSAAAQRQAGSARPGDDTPVGEWDVARLCPRYDAQPPQAGLMLEPGMSARARPQLDPDALAAQQQLLSASPGAHTIGRRLAVTPGWLVERDASTYEVVERRPLE